MSTQCSEPSSTAPPSIHPPIQLPPVSYPPPSASLPPCPSAPSGRISQSLSCRAASSLDVKQGCSEYRLPPPSCSLPREGDPACAALLPLGGRGSEAVDGSDSRWPGSHSGADCAATEGVLQEFVASSCGRGWGARGDVQREPRQPGGVGRPGRTACTHQPSQPPTQHTSAEWLRNHGNQLLALLCCATPFAALLAGTPSVPVAPPPPPSGPWPGSGLPCAS